MKSFIIKSATALPLVLSGVLNLAFAQSDAVPKNTEIKNWPTPLYWLPPAARAVQDADRESSANPGDGTDAGDRSNGKQEEEIANSAAPMTASRSDPTPLTLIPITPCRVMDTRVSGSLPWSPYFSAGETRTIPIYDGGYGEWCTGIPSGALGYSLNFTVLADKGSAVDFLSAWPAGTNWPGTSILNAYTAGLPVANAAVIPAGAGGYEGLINVYVTNATDVLIDINGYYVSGDIGSFRELQHRPGHGRLVACDPPLRRLQHRNRL